MTNEYELESEGESHSKIKIVRLKGEDAKQYAEAVLEKAGADYKDSWYFSGPYQSFKYVPGLNDGQGGIAGSSVYFGILLNYFLMQDGLSLPNYSMGRRLFDKGLLEKNRYSDYGIAVLSPNGWHEDLAKDLAEELDEKNYQLPVILGFRSLRFNANGTEIKLRDELIDSIQGESATRELTKLSQIDDSGVQRITCESYSSKDSFYGWGNLSCSVSEGRLDLVCRN